MSSRLREYVQQRDISMWAGLLGVLLCVIPFYISIVPPMTDVPQHVLISRIISEYDNPILRFSDYFTVEWVLAPTTLFYLIFTPLQKVVGPFWDARLYLTIWVISTWLAVWHLSNVRKQDNPWIAPLIALPITFCWYAYQGFLPYLMTIPLFVLTVAVWMGNMGIARKIFLMWCITLVLFGFHIVGAAVAAATIIFMACIQVLSGKNDWGVFKWAIISNVPLVLVTGVYLGGNSAPKSLITYHSLPSQVFDTIKFTCTSLNSTAAALLLLWLCTLIIILIAFRNYMSREQNILFSAAMLFFLSIAMPVSLGALWPAGPRIMPFAIVLLVVSLPWEKFQKKQIILSSVTLLACLSLFTSMHAHALDSGYRSVLAAAKHIEPGSNILPIVVDKDLGSRWTTPYLHPAAILTTTKGGANPYVPASPYVLTGATPLKFKNPTKNRKYAFFHETDSKPEDYMGVGSSYNYVIMWGNSMPIEAIISGEMSILYEEGRMIIYARK